MELKEYMEIAILLVYYKSLLSEKQKIYMEDHFDNDLSLSEISKKYNISRQAVYDNIKRGVEILKNYEEKIGFFSNEKKLKYMLIDLKENYSVEKIDKILDNLKL